MGKKKRWSKKISQFFFDKESNQKKWFQVFGVVIFPLLLFIWGAKISSDTADNTETLNGLTQLVKNTNQQLELLHRISISTDSTNKSTSSLTDLPSKIGRLGGVIDTLSNTLVHETSKLGNSYKDLQINQNKITKQQSSYLDNLGNVIALTNQEIKQLSKNNEAIKAAFTRRASLKIYGRFSVSPKGKILNSIEIRNLGNIEAKVNALSLISLYDTFDRIDSTRSNGGTFNRVANNIMKLNTKKIKPIVINPGRPFVIVFDRNCYFSTTKLFFGVNLNYSNKLESCDSNFIVNNTYK